MANLTDLQQRLVDYNNILTCNKGLFKAGRSISRDTFINLFGVEDIVNVGTYEELQKSNLKLVSVQKEINMLMRENGLYLKSKNYYKEFKVVEKGPTTGEILRYSGGVDVFTGCTNRLADKMEERLGKNTWGHYNKVPAKDIAQLPMYSTSRRHNKMYKRVTQW